MKLTAFLGYCVLLSFGFSCTKTAKSSANSPRPEQPSPQNLAAKTGPQDVRLKSVEALFEKYKRSHTEKSLVTLKSTYPSDLGIKATWKGSAVPSAQWMANRKKFIDPIKSVTFSDAVYIKDSERDTYRVAFKETVEVYSRKTTTYYGLLETAPADETFFTKEDISVKESDYVRWAKANTGLK